MVYLTSSEIQFHTYAPIETFIASLLHIHSSWIFLYMLFFIRKWAVMALPNFFVPTLPTIHTKSLGRLFDFSLCLFFLQYKMCYIFQAPHLHNVLQTFRCFSAARSIRVVPNLFRTSCSAHGIHRTFIYNPISSDPKAIVQHLLKENGYDMKLRQYFLPNFSYLLILYLFSRSHLLLFRCAFMCQIFCDQIQIISIAA